MVPTILHRMGLNPIASRPPFGPDGGVGATRSTSDLLDAFAFGEDIFAEIDFGTILRKTIEKAQALMHADIASVCLRDSSPQDFQQVVLDAQGGSSLQPVHHDADSDLFGTLNTGHPVARPGTCSVCGISARVGQCASTPLRSRGREVGVLCTMWHEAGHALDIDRLRELEVFAAWVAIAIANALAIQSTRAAARAERDRLIAHLHDHVAQTLILLGHKIEQAESQLANQEIAAAVEQLQGINPLLHGILTQVRTTLGDLVQQAVPVEDLVTALAVCVESFREIARIPVEFTVAGTCTVSAEVQVQALHIMREILTNICRHANAHRILINVTRDHDTVHIMVQDDGKGFNPKLIDSEHHWGIAIMRERASRSGGSLAVDSTPGRGTRVSIAFPVQTQ